MIIKITGREQADTSLPALTRAYSAQPGSSHAGRLIARSLMLARRTGAGAKMTIGWY